MAPDITGATPDIFEKGSEDLAFIKYIRFGKEKGRVEMGILSEDGLLKNCSVSLVLYSHIGEPVARQELDEGALELILSEDEGHRAMKKALSLLSYSDKSKAMLYSRLVSLGYKRVAAREAVNECIRLGYIDEKEQIARFVIREANESLKGQLLILRKALAKGFKSDEVNSVIRELTELGEVDFEANFNRLAEKKGALTEEDRAALRYKNGYTGKA